MKKKWMIGAVMCAALLMGWLVYDKNEAVTAGFIIGPDVPVSITDTHPSPEKQGLQDTTEGLISTSGERIITPRTLSLFKKLQGLFKDTTDMEDHFSKVSAWLKTWYPEEVAEQIMALYREYIACERELASAYQEWGTPTTTEEILSALRAVQDFRRERLGDETADLLYGGDVKSREYRVRKGAVVKDPDLYGAEKEAHIARLNEEMWGDAALSPDLLKNSYNQYQEKLSVYERDLSEMESEDEKNELITSFREAFFSPEVVEKLEQIDSQIDEDSANEAAYVKEEEKILASHDLTPDEKDDAINTLQDQFFGEEADAFRRRETKRKALEALMK